MDLDFTRTYPVRAPRTRHSGHRGNFTNPHFTSPVHEHSFIHSHTSKHRICNYCITTLRIASRSGSRLIRYERRPTEVQRLAREGLKAASRQTEPGEKNRDEPQWPWPTPLRSRQRHLDLSHLILTSSQTHRISTEERPMGHPSLSNGLGIYRGMV